MNIRGSIALVTGANRGLGLAFCKALLEMGAGKVYAGARNPEKVSLSGVIPTKLDVTNAQDIANAAEQLSDVNLLINNAGIMHQTVLLDQNVFEMTKEVMETNFFGTLAMSKAFAPILGRNGGGVIVNVLSALSWATASGTLAYSASKAAELSLTDATRLDLRPQGTQVVAIHAGFIDTDLVADIPFAKISPEVVARVSLQAIEQGCQEVLIDERSREAKEHASLARPYFA